MWSNAKIWKCAAQPGLLHQILLRGLETPRLATNPIPYVTRAPCLVPGVLIFSGHVESDKMSLFWHVSQTSVLPRASTPAPRAFFNQAMIFTLCVESDKMSLFCHVSVNVCVQRRNVWNALLEWLEPSEANHCSILLWICGRSVVSVWVKLPACAQRVGIPIGYNQSPDSKHH